MLILDHRQVNSLLTPELALDALRSGLAEQAAGNVQMPPRQTTDAGDGKGGLDRHTGANWLRISSAFLNSSGVMGFKAMNRAAGLGMRYLIGLYDIASGELLALLDADEVTTARTAAVSALGTHLLADPSSTTVGILGSGVQARALITAYAKLCTVDRVLVFSPTPASRDSFAALVSETIGVPAESVGDPEAVTEATTVLVAVRATRDPVFLAKWLRPGMHVTGLSSVRYDAREVDDETWRRADIVVVDDRVNVAQSGDALSISRTGAYDLSRAPELWSAYQGDVARTRTDEITLFKSAGNAMQDITLAGAVARRAREQGMGLDVPDFPNVKPYA